MINFQKYHEDNPQIYEMFKKFAKEAKAKGRLRLSSKLIFERIRWESVTTGNDGFKLNNNYHADYSRKLMKDFPEFKGFFKTRDLKAQRI